MASVSNKHVHTTSGDKGQQQALKVVEWGDSPSPLHLELNKDGQYVLPFSRRVININLPWLIKEQQTSSMINHGKRLHIEVDDDPQEEEEETKKFLYIVDARINKRDNNNPWHRLYDDDDVNDSDVDNDSMDEGERLLHEYIVDFTNRRWAQYGMSIPKINPFEIYY